MRPRTVGYALAAGIAVLLVAGAIGTEPGTATGVEFSLFVGIPSGLAAGVAAGAVVLLRYEDPDSARRWPALALAGFGVVFVAVVLVAALPFGLRNSVALPIAAAAGLAGGAVALLRGGDRRGG